MKTITKRELNQQTAQALSTVTPREPLLVTERGIARWRIEAVDVPADPVARLFADGRVTPAKAQPQAWPAPACGPYTPVQVDALLADSRGRH
jgi:antitoxin (DNA-binding transcriptional repressor) of toxin-antitoxin stability system